jgi:hypothetical protein
MRSRVVEELAVAGGAELAPLIARAVALLPSLTDAQRLEVVKATARLDAWSAAARAQAIYAVYDSARVDIAHTRSELDEVEQGIVSRRRAAGLPAQRSVAGPAHAYDDRRLLHRRVGTEVSLVLGVSSVVADREVDLAADLAEQPRLRRALAEGLLDRSQALTVLDGVAPLSGAVRRGRVISALLGPDDSPEGDDFDPEEPVTDADELGNPIAVVPELARPGRALWSLTPGRLRHILRREVTRADPAAAQAVAEAARAERRVVLEELPCALAELHLRTSIQAGCAAYANLDRSARAAQQAGDRRTLDQLRADIAIGWLTEGAFGTYVTRPAHSQSQPGVVEQICLPSSDAALVNLTVAATTLLGLDQEPATLHGPHGPIPLPASIAREIAFNPQHTRWRRLLYDPHTGVATDIGRRYQPPRRLDALVRARDGHVTRFPTSCATHLELDHIIEFDHDQPSQGGQTSSGNLASAGRRDHHLKTDGVIQVSGDANQTLTITTPSGRTYVSEPHLYADPEPPRARPAPSQSALAQPTPSRRGLLASIRPRPRPPGDYSGPPPF